MQCLLYCCGLVDVSAVQTYGKLWLTIFCILNVSAMQACGRSKPGHSSLKLQP